MLTDQDQGQYLKVKHVAAWTKAARKLEVLFDVLGLNEAEKDASERPKKQPINSDLGHLGLRKWAWPSVNT